MLTSSTSRDERDTVLEEHRLLNLVVSTLEDWVTPSRSRDPAWRDELARRVAAVHEQLKMHFSGDAEGELFEELTRTAPHLIGKLSALATEHSKILGQFREVGDQARTLEPTDAEAVDRLAIRARGAIATLRRHEAEENEIIVQAIWEDLGTAE